MDKSPLQRLPAEIRNNISELAMYHGEVCLNKGPFCMHVKPTLIDEPNTDWPAYEFPYCKNYLALAQTCKQMRDETLDFFYDINTFSCGPTYGNLNIHERVNKLFNALPSFVAPKVKHVAVMAYANEDTIGTDLEEAFEHLPTRSGISVDFQFRYPVHIYMYSETGVTERLQYFDIKIDCNDPLKSLKAASERKEELMMGGGLIITIEMLIAEYEKEKAL